MGGSSSQQQPTQTTTTALSPQADQLFQMALPGVQSYASTVPQRYQGNTIAGFSPLETQGGNDLYAAANATGGGVNSSLQAGLTGLGNVQNNLDWSPNNLSEYVPGAPVNYTPFVAQQLKTSSDIFNDPGIWNPQFNTGTRSAIDAATRPLYDQLTETVLPNVRGGAITAGGFGGSRQGIAEGLAAGRTQRAAGDTAAKIVEDLYGANLNAVNSRYATNIGGENQRYATNVSGDQARYATNTGDATQRYGIDVNADQARYATNRGLENQRYNTNNDIMLKSIGMIPELTQPMMANATMAPQIQMGLGEQQRAMEQAQINAAVQGYNYDQMAPFLQAKDIMSLAMGFPGQTTTATGNVPQANPWMQSLGGAATGAAIGSAVPVLGTGLGAVGGALLPWLTR